MFTEDLAQRVADAEAIITSASIDVAYALKQLRQHRDVRRAVDALERAQENMAEHLGASNGALATFPP